MYYNYSNSVILYNLRLNLCKLVYVNMPILYLDIIFCYNNIHDLIDSQLFTYVHFLNRNGMNTDILMLKSVVPRYDTFANMYLFKIGENHNADESVITFPSSCNSIVFHFTIILQIFLMLCGIACKSPLKKDIPCIIGRWNL